MARKYKKQKKGFIRIKEKLILVQPKKFFGRKMVGVFCLILGCLVFAVSLAYFYIIPNLIPRIIPKQQVVEPIIQKESFIPKRIMINSLGVDLTIVGNIFQGKMPSNIKLLSEGEIILFGEKDYKIYNLTKIENKTNFEENNISLSDEIVILTLSTTSKGAYIITGNINK